MSENNFYITTPIYYVNSSPHLGHAYTTILCDFYRRFYELAGQNTYFLTGTDEHGDKISKAAEAEGITERELVDKNSDRFRQLLPVINATSNDFIRTTDERHLKVVKELLQKVYDSGDIYFDEYEGLYCYGCERYYGQDELVDGLCPDHKKAPEKISEKNYFFKMSKYWDQLKKKIDAEPDFIKPEGYKNEVLGLLKMKPQDLCISRPKERLTWGVELPFDKNFVTYVWFDALINYISALGYPDGEKFKQFWPASHHVIAKDILKPHCIYWPTMLMAMGIDLPKQIIIHGYWLIDSSKMSKSTGTVVDPYKYCEEFTADVFRYYLIRAMRFGKDAHFSHDEFIGHFNADLANKIGNLYSRICGLLRKNCEGKLPPLSNDSESFQKLVDAMVVLKHNTRKAMDSWQPDEYAESVVKFAEEINKYLDDHKPWSLIKNEESFSAATSILRAALEGVRMIYTYLYPVMPEISAKVLGELNTTAQESYKCISSEQFASLSEGLQLPDAPTGFPRIVKGE